ncbi:molybdopterin-synthase adenylyltransferase MoeB [Devosia sp. XJ19-1]|uniref:Molybdopterin-synthase adenylyltransferase n=1 Tax=Devosia ureilytica TaxID=2952754 RepID=A0A9Q4FRS5_9HYPH|nr:molybdopterin-synthase adenylyltransferase MoeB [Devosia ureilytica]MCP8883139.1 molybdopterin-synthase adenylyltransferase MoeB [Devosia ureilytica]MCP8886493.1 molybdopterin-synthase adenylyltransferase MoeB [Devosia ureilytica]
MASDTPLSPEETRRYARHLVLKGFGGAGQQQLKAARVLVVGAGGLGSPAIAYLAAAGIGQLGIVDPDTVSLSNLQRQVIHATASTGTSKAESAGRFASALNPHVVLDLHAEAVTTANAEALIGQYDLVLDGTDNLVTRRAVATAAQSLGKPLVSGAVSMFSGQVTVFAPHLGGPSHDALYPPEASDDALPSCELNGILGPVTGVIGTLMAMEAIKLITGLGKPLVGRLLVYDARDASFSELSY